MKPKWVRVMASAICILLVVLMVISLIAPYI